MGHQKSGSDSFPRNVANHQPEPFVTQIEKIVVVAANRASLNAITRIVERAQGRQGLRKEPSLYLFCNFEFLCAPPLRFQLLGNSAALCIDILAHFVAAHKDKAVSVRILKPGEGAAPGCCLRRMIEANSALAPFVELGGYVLSHKNHIPAPADELVFVGVGLGSNKRKDRDAIRRGNRYPAITRFITDINEQIEPKLIQVESQASIL